MSDYEIKNNEEFKEAIIRVIAFFDLFDHPLTVFEIRERLSRRIKLSELLVSLDELAAAPANILAEKNGFYFLPGRKDIVSVRQERHNYSARKIKIARRFARVFSLLPFVRMIALANSLGQYNLRDGSDIDFFIISSPRRVWMTRLYCTGLAKLLNRRPRTGKKQDTICLSFYAASDHLNFDDLRLSGEDPYFDYWRQSLVVLYNKNNTYEKFLQANGLLPATGAVFSFNESRSGYFLNSLESVAKKFQLAIMPLALKAAMNDSDGVVINDSILKLYQRDRRREYADLYEHKVNEIIKKNN